VWAVDLPRTRSGITLDEFVRTVGRAELASELLPRLVAAHRDDAIGAHLLRREHAEQPTAPSPTTATVSDRQRGSSYPDQSLPQVRHEAVFHSPHILSVARKIPCEDSLLVQETPKQDRKEWDQERD
jgi:hypothetical protein